MSFSQQSLEILIENIQKRYITNSTDTVIDIFCKLYFSKFKLFHTKLF
jgi:hypothetical protein